jgi:hypothetical protein
MENLMVKVKLVAATAIGDRPATINLGDDFGIQGSNLSVNKRSLISSEPNSGLEMNWESGKIQMARSTEVPIHQTDVVVPALNIRLEQSEEGHAVYDPANGCVRVLEANELTAYLPLPAELPRSSDLLQFNPRIKYQMLLKDGVLALGGGATELLTGAGNPITVTQYDDPAVTFEIIATSNIFGTIEYTSASDKRVLPRDTLTQGEITIEVLWVAMVYYYPKVEVSYKWIFNGDNMAYDEAFAGTATLTSIGVPLYIIERDMTIPVATTNISALFLPITITSKAEELFFASNVDWYNPCLIAKFKFTDIDVAYTDGVPVYDLGVRYYKGRLGLVYS